MSEHPLPETTLVQSVTRRQWRESTSGTFICCHLPEFVQVFSAASFSVPVMLLTSTWIWS